MKNTDPYVERGYHHSRSDSPDFHAFNWKKGLVSTINLERTNVGGSISFLVGKSRFVKQKKYQLEDWLEFGQLDVILVISFGVTEDEMRRSIEDVVNEYWFKIISLCKELNTPIPIESFLHFPESYRRWIWRFHRRFIKQNYQEFTKDIGINRFTTLDYLNLQSLGCKDYQAVIAKEDNAKPLAIRDRIAYARRHGWIESAEHGERMPFMTKVVKK